MWSKQTNLRARSDEDGLRLGLIVDAQIFLDVEEKLIAFFLARGIAIGAKTDSGTKNREAQPQART